MSARDLIFTILGIDKASDKFDDVGDSIERMGSRASKVVLGVSEASAGASLAVAGAVAAVPVLFAAIGAAALAQNRVVKGSFNDLSQTIRSGVVADAAPLQATFVDAAHEIGAAYQQLRPLMRAAFQAADPAVRELTHGVTGLAREALPGMVTAAQQSQPVFRALNDVLRATGRGAGETFEIFAEGAPNAAHGVEAFGDLVEGVLPNVGHLLVDLSDMWAEHGDQAVRVINKLVDVTTDLGSHALPVVSDAMGVALDVLEGALNVIGPLADKLGPLIGLWLSLNFALKAVGTAQAAILGVVGAVQKLREGMSEAGGGAGLGRFSTGIKGALTMLGGPWGAALVAAGIALAIFGQRSQDAAAAQRALADALRDSGGEFDTDARRALANSDQYKHVADAVERAGLSHSEYIDAVINGGPRLDDLKRRLQDQVAAGTEVSVVGQGAAVTMTAQAAAAQQVLTATDGLRHSVVGAANDFRREGEAVGGATAAMVGAVPGSASLRDAMKTLGDETADTSSRVDALNTAWRQLFGITLDLEDATAQWEAGLDTLREQIEETKKGTSNWRGELFSANGAINLSTEAGRQLQSNLVSQGESYRALAQATYDTARRQGLSHEAATASAQAAVDQRRRQFMAEIGTLGLTAAQVDALARRYLGLPGDVMTVIRADTSPAHGAISTLVNRWDGRVITVYVQARGTPLETIQAYAGGRPVGMKARAGGGPIDPGEWYLTGEEGRELITPREPGMVLPADHTRQILAALAATRRATAGGMSAMSLTRIGRSSAPGVTRSNVININFSGPVTSKRQAQDWLVSVLDDLQRQGRI